MPYTTTHWVGAMCNHVERFRILLFSSPAKMSWISATHYLTEHRAWINLKSLVVL